MSRSHELPPSPSATPLEAGGDGRASPTGATAGGGGGASTEADATGTAAANPGTAEAATGDEEVGAGEEDVVVGDADADAGWTRAAQSRPGAARARSPRWDDRRGEDDEWPGAGLPDMAEALVYRPRSTARTEGRTTEVG